MASSVRRAAPRNTRQLRRALGAVLARMVLAGLGRAEILQAVTEELRGLQQAAR